MLVPKSQKHRKHHRGRMKGIARRGSSLNQGEYGLQALEPGWIRSRQIWAARVAIARIASAQGGKMWIQIYPQKPVTEKPPETRGGKGKGAPAYWVAPVKRGRILFEVSGLEREDAMEALRRASHKLPIKTKVVSRQEW